MHIAICSWFRALRLPRSCTRHASALVGDSFIEAQEKLGLPCAAGGFENVRWQNWVEMTGVAMVTTIAYSDLWFFYTSR